MELLFCLESLQNNCINHPVTPNICYVQFFTQYFVAEFCFLLYIIYDILYVLKLYGSVFLFDSRAQQSNNLGAKEEGNAKKTGKETAI